MQKQKGISSLAIILIIVGVVIIIGGGVFAWQYFTTKSQTPITKSQTAGWQGIYSMAGYNQTATLEQIDSKNVKLTVIGPDVRPNEPSCSFSGTGTVNLNTLTINLDNSQYSDQKDAKVIVKLSSDKKQLTIEANSFDNRFALMRFCYGGGSIGGTYVQNSNAEVASPKAFNWEGAYNFTEVNPSTPSGVAQTWSYDLSISSADGKWHLGLNVDGFQTLIRINATANNVGNSLDVVFDSYGADNGNIGGNFKKGDVLFMLTPTSSGLVIQWKKMQPNLEKNLTGSIFKKILDQAAGWKTYTNSEYGFSFRYPASLATSEYLDKETNKFYVSLKTESITIFSFDVVKETFNQYIAEVERNSGWDEGYNFCENVSSVIDKTEDIKFAGLDAKKITLNKCVTLVGPINKPKDKNYVDIFIPKGDQSYLIVLSPSMYTYGYDKISDTLLSTFKFTK